MPREHLTLDFTPEVFADTASRRISGLAIPLDATAEKGGRTWRFKRGSVKFGTRTPLLAYHDPSKPVGRLESSRWSDRGLEVVFQVSKTSGGDEVLQLANDGVLGLSVGIDVSPGGAKDVNGEFVVSKALAAEISLTPIPAFAGSVIDHVALSGDATEGNIMPDTDMVTPVTVTLDAQALGAAIAAGLATTPTEPQTPEGPQPQPVPRAMATVNEEAPYRFDRRGNLTRGAQYDFSTDLVAGSRGDGEALQRAETFVREQFDVDRADVAGLNPSRQRPDLYTDQRDYQYPVWDAISKGTLADSTPFVFPKFNTSSGLVAAHVEGTEPTPGVFTATTQTVTPTAVSGKVELTREAWDQGGNPQMSNLIWRQMTRAWNEALEASAVAVLDAATPTAIALTAGGGTTGQTLDAELTAAFAALQFIRGGFTMDTMFTQVDLYKALIAAQDDTGRRLYPALGPVNATGTARSRFAALDINGVAALPAWALAATGSVVASSYLFDSAVVHGWATTPQRLQFEYRVAYVDLAIFGYKATAISDLTGVRELTFDPVA